MPEERAYPAEDSTGAKVPGLESRVGAGPRASVPGVPMGKAVGDEMGRVGWRQMTHEKCSGIVHK